MDKHRGWGTFRLVGLVRLTGPREYCSDAPRLEEARNKDVKPQRGCGFTGAEDLARS